MHRLPPLSLYIHVPWCVKKCPYCDFNSHALKGELAENDYVTHLMADLDADLPLVLGRAISSIFIGGGTPSLLSAEAVQRLLDAVRMRVSLTDDVEITLEANPGTVDAERFAGYQRAGVNRLSIGVQSLNAQKLEQLGRIHSPQHAICAARLAESLAFNVNLDLMHGLPDQTLEEALDDLHQIVALSPAHISWYQLTIEPNTAFHARPPVLPHEDILWEIGQQGHEKLLAAGYQQYEISAYARPGYQCRHNLNYWRFGDYLGIGCGAHGKITLCDGRIVRRIKNRHPVTFMQGRYLDKHYQVDIADRPFEFFMNRFRLLEETLRSDFSRLTGLTECHIRVQLDAAKKKGWLQETEEYWQVTEQGRWFLNSLLTLFL